MVISTAFSHVVTTKLLHKTAIDGYMIYRITISNDLDHETSISATRIIMSVFRVKLSWPNALSFFYVMWDGQ